MSGLSDEAVLEGHDLIDSAEHEAQADPKDFKLVHPVGETGGSILPDNAATSSNKPTASAGQQHTTGDFFEGKLAELKDKLLPTK